MNFYEEYIKRIKDVDENIDAFPARFTVNDKNSKFYGTCASFEMLADTIDIGAASSAAVAYSCKDSKHYKSEKMLDYIEHYSKAILSKLNDDGTNNMLASNFHTGEQFGLVSLSLPCLVMRKYLSGGKRESDVYEILKGAVERIADGCIASGFHTPNHRWVETAGLLNAYDLIGKEEYLAKAKKYLAEGVDCDEYGEYSERSAGMYNAHCDTMFLCIYDQTENEEYLNAVCRNLDLMRYYINDDFSMFTQNSRRKDKGEVGSVPMFYKATTYYADVYTTQYALAAYLKKDALLATVAKKILENSSRRGGEASVALWSFLLHPEMKTWEFEPVDGAIPKTFEKYQPKSNIVRKKTENATYSFLAKNPSFLQIDAAGISMKVRMCSSFFAVAQFEPQTMEKTERGYKLSMVAHGEYKLPLDNPDGITTKDYWSIDYSARKSIQELDLRMTVEAEFNDGGVELSVFVDGCDKVPTKIEFAVNDGLLCEMGDVAMLTRAGANAFSRSGSARFESPAGAVLTIDGLFCKHIYAEGMRGSLDPIGGAFTLYATDFTPIARKIKISVEKADGRRMFC